jgi:site-specific DNA recombinase
MCEMKEKSKGEICNIANINGNVLDTLVIDKIKEIINEYPPTFGDVSGKMINYSTDSVSCSELQMLEKRLTSVEQSIQNMLTAISLSSNQDILVEMTKRVEALTIDKIELINSINQVKNSSNCQDEAPDCYSIINSLSPYNDNVWDFMGVGDKREICKCIINKLTWDGEVVQLCVT